jgi:hypothetical protein
MPQVWLGVFLMQAILDVFPGSRFFKSKEEVPHFSEWNKTHDWIKVEELNGYAAWTDFGYGLNALTHGDKLVGSGKYTVAGNPDHPNIVLLDKDYYGTEYYLFAR